MRGCLEARVDGRFDQQVLYRVGKRWFTAGQQTNPGFDCGRRGKERERSSQIPKYLLTNWTSEPSIEEIMRWHSVCMSCILFWLCVREGEGSWKPCWWSCVVTLAELQQCNKIDPLWDNNFLTKCKKRLWVSVKWHTEKCWAQINNWAPPV